eukprot:5484914-Pyramimonas_sp.AAC.1
MTSLTLESMSALLDAKFGENLAPINAKLTTLEERADRTEERLTKLEAASSSGQAASRFVPTFIEIKNFCEYGEWRTKGVTRVEAEAIREKLIPLLPAGLQGAVGTVEMFGPRGWKIRLTITPPYASEISQTFNEYLKEASNYYKDRELYTTVEREPEVQALFSTGGRARAFLEQKVHVIDPGAKVTCSWRPDWELKITTSTGREVTIGTIDATAKVVWIPEGVTATFRTTPEALQTEFKDFRGSSAAPKICKVFRKLAGDFVALLQEVPTWGNINGFTYSGHTVLAAESCDCAIVIPRVWMSGLRDFASGAYWCGAVIGNTIYLSVHVLDHLEEDARAARAFEDSSRFVQRIREASQSVQFDIVLGVDANIQFPMNFGS